MVSGFHLDARDAALLVVSRAPIATIQAWKKLAGWEFPWVSSHESEFNQDFEVTQGDKEYPGISVFAKEGEEIFLTYSARARGLEALNSTYGALDLMPKGRDEAGLTWPMAWVDRKAEA